MAGIFDPNKDKDAEAQAAAQGGVAPASAQPSAAPQPVTIGSGQSANVSAAAPSGSAGKPSTSGRFTNLQSYMKANQPTQGNSLADKMGNKFEQQKNQNVQGIQQSQQQFNTQANANRVQVNQDMLGQAVADPSKFLQTAQQTPTAMNEFTRMRAGQYSGPRSLENAGQLQVQTQNFQDLTKQTGSEAGRFGLLKSMFNKDGYNRGQQTLDNLLLQGNKQEMQKLQQNRAQAADLSRTLKSTEKQVNQTAGEFSNEAQETRKNVLGALTGEAKRVDDELETRRTQLATERQNAINSAKVRLQHGTATKEDMERLGLSEGMDLYDVDASKFLKANQLEATRQNVAKQEEFARMKALGSLFGEDIGAVEDASKRISQYQDDQEAEKFQKSSAYELDKQLLEGAVAERRNEYNRQIVDPQNRMGEADAALGGNWFFNNGLEGASNAIANNIRNAYAKQLANVEDGTGYNGMTAGMYGSNSMLNKLGFQQQQQDLVNKLGAGQITAAEYTAQNKALRDQAIAKMNSMKMEDILGGGYLPEANLGDSIWQGTGGFSQTEISNQLWQDISGRGMSPDQRILQQLNSERQKKAENQAKFQQLQNLFKANRKLGVADPNVTPLSEEQAQSIVAPQYDPRIMTRD